LQTALIMPNVVTIPCQAAARHQASLQMDFRA